MNATSATAMLMTEHRNIEKVLGALSAMARSIRGGEEFEVADARDAVGFLRDYADRAHHAKEEDRLFPAMEQRGLPREAGPTAVMRHEHDEGRAHVAAMQTALDAEPADLTAFARRATAFSLLLHDHIAKEDQILFPMADQMVGPTRLAELLDEFVAFNNHDVGAATMAEFVALADRLAAKYDVRPRVRDGAGPLCHRG